MDELKWDDLRIFLAVARKGTLSAAAHELGINASTAHRRISALEKSLETTLFEKAPRGYALTGVGEAVLTRAEDVEEAVLSLRRTATGHDRTARGPVTLTTPETLLSLITPQIAEVQKLCPGLRPILRTEDHILNLGEEADIALRPSRSPPQDAVGRRIGTIQWAVYALEENQDQPWIIYSKHTGPTAAREWRQKQHPNVPVALEVSSVGAMHHVLQCTRAQGLLPCYMGDLDPHLKRITGIVEEAATDLWLLIHADLRKSARVRALVELLTPRLEATRDLLEGRR